jgi:hypothetical protein
MGVSELEFQAILRRCRGLPAAQGTYRQTDYILNLFLTVLDYRSSAEAVRKALMHYRDKLWDEIRTYDDLVAYLADFPNDPRGNLEAGKELWGAKAERRIVELRGLVKFFGAKGVKDQETLTNWARRSSFRDFMGQVRGLNLQVYEALLTRQGYGPIKPSAHLNSFVMSAIGRPLPGEDLVEALQRVAHTVGVETRELERRIYEQYKRPAAS